VASFFISRWDAAVASIVPAELSNQLGLAIGRDAYVAYRRFFSTDRWQRLLNEGARPQRLLFASTGTKDPAASDTLYVSGLAAPNTVNTMPQETLLALADHGMIGETLTADATAAAAGLERFADAGVDVEAVGDELQSKGAQAFVTSWNALLGRIEAKVSEVSRSR
jgi:transaldolase